MKILITAGPTREPIDPVRFISNYSTGAIGYAIAKAANANGHKTILISGPSYLPAPKKIRLIKIITAQEMFEAVKKYAEDADCIIMAAAVSDFRPALYSAKKLKRSSNIESIRVKKNPDILSRLGKRKGRKILVGFCMETGSLFANARNKLKTKNLDIIVANRIDRKRAAFGEGKTSAVILESDGRIDRLSHITKDRLAHVLLDKIERLWYKRSPKI